MRLRRPLMIIVLAAAVSAIGVGISLAKGTVTTFKAEKVSALKLTVLADAKGRTLYRLKPETPKHLLCTSKTCLQVWLPATVASKSTKVKLPKGITGKVTLLHRGKKLQVCVGGFPLYRFVGDDAKGKATGQHLKSFGGVWNVVKIKSAKKTAPVAPSPPPAY
jgi:predicted lipoprotein with Yx(FWY)xxD motif